MQEPRPQPKIRSRQCLFVLYPESQQEQIEYCQQNLPCAWALHDKDVYEHDDKDGKYKKGDPKKPHMHFVCKFPNARWFSAIAKEIGVPENTINRCNNLYKAYVYLWHELAPEKYQYDPSIVGFHEFDVPSEHVGISAEEDEQIKLLLEMPSFDSFYEMSRWVYENGCWASFRSNYSMWRDIFLESRTKYRGDRGFKKFCADYSELTSDVVDPF